MHKVKIYTKQFCPYCRLAKDLLSARQIDFEEIQVDQDQEKFEEMIRLSHKRTVPQIFIDDQSIGGYDEIAALARSGKLDDLLKT